MLYIHKGAYDEEEAAARTYDLAALKYWGAHTTLNFPVISKNILYFKPFSLLFYVGLLLRS